MNEARTSLAAAAAAAGAALHDLRDATEEATKRTPMLVRASEECYLAPEPTYWGIPAPSLRPRNQRQRRRDDRRVRPHGRKGGKR